MSDYPHLVGSDLKNMLDILEKQLFFWVDMVGLGFIGLSKGNNTIGNTCFDC